ncbi:hypothetical protein M2344_002665 [Sphingobium sp. B8D3C]|nr:hypothetical protein [Sphingobium sp. B8D3B]MCW2419703.1 hypothetical protein [Sphingobium sp. B8D3C]
MLALGSILFPLAGAAALATIIKSGADYRVQARAALSALFHGGSQ